MSSLDVVLFKKAADEAWLRPFDPNQQGWLGAGGGALLGAGIGGLGGLAFGRKGRRLSSGLKGALLGAAGGGALGGYSGYNSARKRQDDYWNNELGPDTGWNRETFTLDQLKGNNGGMKKLFDNVGGYIENPTAEQQKLVQDESPGRRLGGWLPFTAASPSRNAVARASSAFRRRAQGAMAKEITLTPRDYLDYLNAGGPEQFGYAPLSGGRVEQAILPDYKWSFGDGDPSSTLRNYLSQEY